MVLCNGKIDYIDVTSYVEMVRVPRVVIGVMFTRLPRLLGLALIDQRKAPKWRSMLSGGNLNPSWRSMRSGCCKGYVKDGLATPKPLHPEV